MKNSLEKTDRPILLLGAGGHARVLIETLIRMKKTILGCTDSDLARRGTRLDGIPILGTDEAITAYSPNEIHLVMGLGPPSERPKQDHRLALIEKWLHAGYSFLTTIHPEAIVSSNSIIDSGVQIFAGAMVQPGASIGKHSVLNTGAQLDHDARLGAHVHLAPGAVVCGSATVDDETFIGAGAIVIDGIKIGKNCCVGAGAVVIQDLPDQTWAVGVPARERSRHREL